MRRVLVAVVAAGWFFALAACSSEPRPIEPEPSASATPAVPVVPDAAGENTPEGAEAFLHYYIEVINYASHTGDTGPLQQASTPDCTGCQDYIKKFDERAERGGTIVNGDWHVATAEQSTYGIDQAWVATIHLAAGSVQESADSEFEEFSASDEVVTLIAGFNDSQWQMMYFAPGRKL
ncbi:MAG: DUF6318 family protein [Aeromicrobium sp.]|uniref:DUF6318 family protein n=1 Tax=Aeromicrobium sp. TaxID=1871063 RepID=UPI0039E4C9E9